MRGHRRTKIIRTASKLQRHDGQHQSRSRTSTSKSADRSRILALGLSLAGFGSRRQRCSERLRLRRFRSHYGVGPAAIRALLSDLRRHQPEKVHDLSCLFMAIMWLKLYDTEEVMAGRWNFGEGYCRKTVRDYVLRIQRLKTLKITFEGLHSTCTFLPVDTCHLRTQEFRCDPSSIWWSHKFNGPAVSFEVVTDPLEGKIRWINGPEPASTHDLTFLRGGKKGQQKKWKKSALYFHIPKTVRLVGDSAYQGQQDKVTTTKDAHKPATKKLFARMKSMQETCFKRFKDFKVLRDSFRHGKNTNDKLAKIKMSFEAVAVLLQYDFENGSRLFEV